MLTWWTWGLLCGLARAEPYGWQGPVEPGHVVLIELIHRGTGADGRPDEELAARILSADDSRRSQTGWRPDLDPRPGQVRLELPALWLAPGDYVERVHLGGQVIERDLAPALAAPRLLSAVVPAGVTGVRALRLQEGSGHDGWAFAPAHDGVVFLPLGEGTWSPTVIGPSAERHSVDEVGPMDPALRIQPRPAAPSTPRTPGRPLLVALGLAPATLVVGAAAAWGLRRAWRLRGLPVALLVAALLGLLALLPVLPDPGAALLMSPGSFQDPPTSAALVAALADSAPRLRDVSAAFGFPAGHSWLVVGPSWLGYLPVLPVAWLTDAVTAHNLGVALGVAALALAAWGLARQLGAGTVAALLAGAGAALAPVIWSDLSRISLDRLTLCLVPLFVLCLERAAREPGWRWPVAAGVTLAAAFYGQVYYGVYLAVAAPAMAATRLVGPQPWARLRRLALAGLVAAVVIAPGALVFREGMRGTVHDAQAPGLAAWLTEQGRPLLEPVRQEEATAFLRSYGRDLGTPQERPMQTPGDYLLVSVTNSIPSQGLWAPSSTVAGRGLYWPLALVGVLLATATGGRRGAALRVGLDTLLLMVLALGPLLRAGGEEVGRLMPYYGLMLAIPGFEQLKHPDRYLLLAATLSSVPLALGVDGLARRLFRAPGPGRTALAATVTLALIPALIGLTLPPGPGPAGQPTLRLPLGGGQHHLHAAFSLPDATPLPRSAALSGLEPGPTLLLPWVVPAPQRQYLRALQHGLPVVNEAPYGDTQRSPAARWIEDNPLLAHATWLAGTDRVRRLAEPGAGERARQALRADGLRWIVLERDALAGPELEAPLTRWMDATFARAAQDEQVVVWSIEPPGAAP